MAEDYYKGLDESGDGAEEAKGPAALLPKSLFGSRELKPGDTVTIKISRVMEDEVEVEPGEPEEPEAEMEETETDETMPPESMTADAELDSMATQPA